MLFRDLSYYYLFVSDERDLIRHGRKMPHELFLYFLCYTMLYKGQRPSSGDTPVPVRTPKLSITGVDFNIGSGDRLSCCDLRAVVTGRLGVSIM